MQGRKDGDGDGQKGKSSSQKRDEVRRKPKLPEDGDVFFTSLSQMRWNITVLFRAWNVFRNTSYASQLLK